VPSTGTFQLRQYALSGPPGTDSYRITVRRIKAGKTSSGKATAAGAVSNLLWSIRAGQVVQLSHPAGPFGMSEELSTAPLVLISAGIGAAPLFSILNHVTKRVTRRPVSWIHCSPHKGPFEDHVRELAEHHPNIDIKFFRSQAPRFEKQDPEYPYEHGRLDLASIGLEKLHLDHGATEYYICGPEDIMEDVAAFLIVSGISKSRVKCEVFTTGDLVFKKYGL
jgi:nitric oxide dioxygenase